MRIFDLFNVKSELKSLSKSTLDQNGKNSGISGAFITPQALLSFPVASGLVAGLWELCKKLFPVFGNSIKLLVIISLLIGFLIWYISTSDPESNLSKRDKILSIIIAIINSLCLAMTAMGISYGFRT